MLLEMRHCESDIEREREREKDREMQSETFSEKMKDIHWKKATVANTEKSK